MLKRDFSWSYTRHRMFERCPRAYYYHYYASWGGWDQYGFEKSKLLYRLKNLQSLDIWAQNIFRETLKQIFNDQKLSADYFKRTTIFRGRKELFSMKSPSFEGNPKNKLLKEIFVDGRNLDDVINRAEHKLSALASLFPQSKAWEILCSIDPLSVKHIPEPSCFIFNGIKIWTKPEFIWSAEGRLKILNISFQNPLQSEHWAFKATLDMMLAQEVFPGNQAIDISSFFLHQPDFPEITISRNKKEVASIIDNSCHKMLELTNLDTNIKEELFEKKNGNACRFCNFQKACSN